MPVILDEPTEVTPPTAEVWHTVDVAEYFEDRVEPVCAILELRNRANEPRHAGARPAGASWPGDQWRMMPTSTHVWVGTSGAEIDLYRWGNVQWWIRGCLHSDEGAGFENPVNLNVGSTEESAASADNWTTIDLNGHTEGDDTAHLGLLAWVRPGLEPGDISGYNRCGARSPTVSSDSPWPWMSRISSGYVGNHVFTDNGEAAVWNQGKAECWFMGYVSEGDRVARVYEDKTAGQSGWQTVTATESGGDHVWVKAGNATRWPGSGDETEVAAGPTWEGQWTDEMHFWADYVAPLDNDGQYDVYLDPSGTDAFSDEGEHYAYLLEDGSTLEPDLIEAAGIAKFPLYDDIWRVPFYERDELDGTILPLGPGSDHAFKLEPVDEADFKGFRVDMGGGTYGIADLSGDLGVE